MTLSPELAVDARTILNDYLPRLSLTAPAWERIEERVKRLGEALERGDEQEFARVLVEIEEGAATRLPLVGGPPGAAPPPHLLEFMNKLVHTLDDELAGGDGDPG